MRSEQEIRDGNRTPHTEDDFRYAEAKRKEEEMKATTTQPVKASTPTSIWISTSVQLPKSHKLVEYKVGSAVSKSMAYLGGDGVCWWWGGEPCTPVPTHWRYPADEIASLVNGWDVASPPANDRQFGGSHYRKMTIQHWDYIIANGIPYLEACAIKYISRWRDKGGIEDLRKSIHYIEKLIETELAKEKQ